MLPLKANTCKLKQQIFFNKAGAGGWWQAAGG